MMKTKTKAMTDAQNRVLARLAAIKAGAITFGGRWVLAADIRADAALAARMAAAGKLRRSDGVFVRGNGIARLKSF